MTMTPYEEQQIRDAGRGHLLGDGAPRKVRPVVFETSDIAALKRILERNPGHMVGARSGDDLLALDLIRRAYHLLTRR